MKLFLTRPPDTRQRYRFLADPLEGTEYHVDLLDTRTLRQTLASIAKLWRSRRSAALLVIIGFSDKHLLLMLCARLLGQKFLIRLGGDPIRGVLDSAPQPSLSLSSALQLLKWSVRWMIFRISFWFSSDFIVVSKHLEATIRQRAGKAARIFVIPAFCRGAARHRAYGPGRPAGLLTVTNLRYKTKADGVVWLIDRLAEIAGTTGHALTFRIAGGGTYLRDIARHLDTIALPDQLAVELLGFVEDIAEEYARADLFLYRSDHDTFGLALLEAKRDGLPVLVNDYPPFREVMTADRSGLFYQDASSFAAGLRQLLEDEALRRRLGTEAVREHEEIFSLEASRARLRQSLATVAAAADP